MPHPIVSHTTPERPADATPERIAGVALKTFFRIAGLWALGTEEQRVLLGGVSRATLFNWKKKGAGSLSRDTLERISYIVGIYRALQILLPRAESANAWIKKPNTAPLFQGVSALQRMLQGRVSDLYVVRMYLDAQRGGWA